MKRVLLSFSTISLLSAGVSAQSPGGVSTGLTLWLKANTTVPGNITYNTANKVSNWKSDVGTYQVSQPTYTKQPVFVNTPFALANMNFNPSVKFNKDSLFSLFNTATTPNLLGTAGTVIMATNKYSPAGFGNMLTYYSSSSYRFQLKPSFRVQNGVTSTGYKFDLNTLPGVIINYPDESAFILSMAGTGLTSRARRNATDFGPPTGNSSTFFPAISAGLYLGANNTVEYSSHALGEVIMYTNTLTAAEQARVESYLAIKYGVTFDELASQSTNYLASDATIVWNKSANTGYNENIAGIARDDASGLMQKQARSVNSNGVVAIFNGNTNGVFPAMNPDNNSVITADKSFFMAGDNNADTNMVVCLNNGYMSRMGRIWKVQKTGTIGAVTLAVDVNQLMNAKKLMVADNPSFTGAVYYPLQNSGSWKYAAVTLNSNQYFTFASDSMVLPQFQNTPVCPGQNGVITVTNAVPGAVYSWYTAQTGGTPFATGSSCTVTSLTGSTTVWVETTSPFNCVLPGRVQAIAQTANILTLKTNNDTAVCAGQPVFINTVSNGTSFSWTPATGLSSPTIANPVATPLTTTRYILTATLAGCTKKDTLDITILPGPAVDAGPDINTITGDPVTLLGSAGTNNILWSPSSGLSNPAILNPIATPLATTVYRLTATNANGCKATDSMTVFVIANCIRRVNAFTPNGDGINDKWIISNGFGCITKMSASVFNRYGRLVYSSADYKNDWDGRYKGKPVPDGTYYYVVVYYLISGKQITDKGDVTILR